MYMSKKPWESGGESPSTSQNIGHLLWEGTTCRRKSMSFRDEEAWAQILVLLLLAIWTWTSHKFSANLCFLSKNMRMPIFILIMFTVSLSLNIESTWIIAPWKSLFVNFTTGAISESVSLQISKLKSIILHWNKCDFFSLNFFFYFFLKLKDNGFTEFWDFLSYINKNQP